jgi:hypothetical protein
MSVASRESRSIGAESKKIVLAVDMGCPEHERERGTGGLHDQPNKDDALLNWFYDMADALQNLGVVLDVQARIDYNDKRSESLSNREEAMTYFRRIGCLERPSGSRRFSEWYSSEDDEDDGIDFPPLFYPPAFGNEWDSWDSETEVEPSIANHTDAEVTDSEIPNAGDSE